MISTRALKNIQIQEFEEFFRDYSVPGRTVRIKANSRPEKYENIRTLIQEVLGSESPQFTTQELDDFLFEKIFYANSNYHVIYQYNGFFADMRSTIDDVNGVLDQYPDLRYNASLFEWTDNEDQINHCTLRTEFTQQGTLKAVHILLRLATLDQYYGKTNAFCAVTIDVVNEFCILRFDQQQHELMTEPLSLHKSITDMLKGLGGEGKKFEPLDLNIIQISESESTAAIYELFAELSAEAEAILNERVTTETEQKIKDFLADLVTEVKDDYVEQIKNVVYQDITESMEDTPFQKGWIFKFHFREGDYTRASSRNEKRLPIYNVKSFWQLKELIHIAQSMHEASFHWHINERAGDEDFIDVRIESKSGTIITHYYSKMRDNRKEREEYVVRKIKAYL